MRIQFSWRLTLLSTAILLFATVATTLTLQSCDRRACKAFTKKADGGPGVEQIVSTPCKGYVCDKESLICKTTCTTDDDCDKGAVGTGGTSDNSNQQSVRHYVCKKDTGTCVCNVKDKSLNCHRFCETSNDCNFRNDPKLNKLLETKRGYSCVKLSDKPTRTCECRTPSAGCCNDIQEANVKRACQIQCQKNSDCDTVWDPTNKDPAGNRIRLSTTRGYVCKDQEGTSFKTCQCNPDATTDLPCKSDLKEPGEEGGGEESSTGEESSDGEEDTSSTDGGSIE